MRATFISVIKDSDSQTTNRVLIKISEIISIEQERNHLLVKTSKDEFHIDTEYYTLTKAIKENSDITPVIFELQRKSYYNKPAA